MATLITGGTGFIGSKLVNELLAGGEEIHLLCHKQDDKNLLKHDALKRFYGDVTDKDSLKPAIQGCRKVFHLAGHARNWAKDPAVYFRVNVEGFRNVAELAIDNNIEKMVLTSTSMVLGPSNGTANSEAMAGRYQVFFTDYERTKYLAELEAEKFLNKGLLLVIVRPTRVYGPGKMTEGNSVTRMIDLFRRGKFPFILGKGLEIGNYVFIDDVVEGHVKAMLYGQAGRKYILGGENISLKDFFLLLSEISGRQFPRFRIPPAVAGWFAGIEEIRAALFGSYPLVSKGWVKAFLRHWAFSSEQAVTELGYRFRGLGEGLTLTYNWLVNNEPSG